MTVTPDSVRDHAPELSDLSDDDVQPFIDQALRRTNVDAWAGKADDGVIALACHMITLWRAATAQRTHARGPLTAESVGPISRSFAAPPSTMTDAYLARTTYGQEYAELRSLVFACREL